MLPGQAAYLFFVPAILIGSAIGGWRPGVFATVLGLLIGLFFVADFRSLSPPDVVSAVAFALVGIGASWRGELLHRSRLAAMANAARGRARARRICNRFSTPSPRP